MTQAVGGPAPAVGQVLSQRKPGYYRPNTSIPAGYVLTKVLTPSGYKDGYDLDTPFEYVHKDGTTYIVPASGCLNTDLASIPVFATWLVPKDAAHTQPALLHDAMIVSPGEAQDYIGPPVGDEKADEILREGMRVAGVPFVRRWMIWTAVSLRSIWICRGPVMKIRLAISLVVFAVFGLFALPDLLDFPQFFHFEFLLWALVLLVPLAAGLLIKSDGPAKWRTVVISGVLAGVGAVLLVAYGHNLPSHVPSLLPDLHENGAGWHWGGWSWQRAANNDPIWIQGGAYVGMLLVGAAANYLFLLPRPKFGALIAGLLVLLAYPLFFVLCATAVYWVVEGAAMGLKKVFKS